MMTQVLETEVFSAWFRGLRDRRGKFLVGARIERLADGNLGDRKSVGGGVQELRIDFGPGYRVYFTQRGLTILLLLCGGDKSSQNADILRAKKMAAEWTED